MSWTPEAVVVVGYRIPHNLWRKGFEYCEDHCDDADTKIPEDWEDYFIGLDPIRDGGDTFFGQIIYTVPEDGLAKEFDTILADATTIRSIQKSFETIFHDFYVMTGFPLPSFNKYLGIRWT